MLYALLIGLLHHAPHHGCVRVLIHYTGTVGRYGYWRRVLFCPVTLPHHWVRLG